MGAFERLLYLTAPCEIPLLATMWCPFVYYVLLLDIWGRNRIVLNNLTLNSEAGLWAPVRNRLQWESSGIKSEFRKRKKSEHNCFDFSFNFFLSSYLKYNFHMWLKSPSVSDHVKHSPHILLRASAVMPEEKCDSLLGGDWKLLVFRSFWVFR